MFWKGAGLFGDGLDFASPLEVSNIPAEDTFTTACLPQSSLHLN